MLLPGSDMERVFSNHQLTKCRHHQLTGSDAVRAFFVLAMSASNTYGAVLTVRWLRLQRGWWVWLTLLPTILGITTPSGSGSSFAG